MSKERSEVGSINSQNEQEKPVEEKPKEAQPSGDEKMKQVLRQLFQDKQDLKKMLENEINEHKSDVKHIMEERDSIQAEYKKLAELLANQQPVSSGSTQQQNTEDLKNQINDLNGQIRALKIQLNDANLNQQVLQKQVDQYKLTVTGLEEDLTKADSDKYQLAVTKTRVSQLEDELRQKTRQIKELETAAKWNNHELQKLKGQLTQAGARSQILGMEVGQTVSVAPRNSMLPSAARNTFKEIEQREPENENEIAVFIQEIPSKIRTLEDERNSLNRQLSEFKRKFSKVKAQSTAKANELSPEKMEETIKILVFKNEKKKEIIENLKSIAERQHAAILKLKAESGKK